MTDAFHFWKRDIATYAKIALKKAINKSLPTKRLATKDKKK